MRIVSSRYSRFALVVLAAFLAASSDLAHAQYYSPYPLHEDAYRYGRDSYAARRDAYEHRHRRLLPPRELDDPHIRRSFGERRAHRHPAQHRKAKRHRDAPKRETSRPARSTPKGPYLVVVSLNRQHLSLYGASGLIRRAAVSTGMRTHPTPTGVFTVLGKKYFHRSNLYSAAPMPLMQRITWSGIALHQGPLPGYPASHGCIRMTNDFAHFLWKTTRIGTRVIVAKNDPVPVDIESERLFKPVKKTYDRVAKLSSLATSAITASKRAARDAPPADEIDSIMGAASTHGEFRKLPVISSYKGPVSVFISRKTAKLYIRYNYQPIFETPVDIAEPDRPIGTHVFTAMQVTDDGLGMRWNVISIPTPSAEEATGKKQSRRVVADIADKPPVVTKDLQTPASALDRIAMPREAARTISELLSAGSSMTVSDYGISDETGNETDFIVLTR